MSKLTLACVGAGNWGRNLTRTFASLPDVRLKTICDASESALEKMSMQYPQAGITTDYSTVLDDSEIQAVVLAVPTVEHFESAHRALVAGKHVYVEKPIALSLEKARALTELAEAKNLTLMVGHLLEYHPAVDLLKKKNLATSYTSMPNE